MTTIHHATLAKAKKFGVELVADNQLITALDKRGEVITAGTVAKDVLEAAITALTGKPAKGTPEGKTAAKAARKASAKPAKAVDPTEAFCKEQGAKKDRWGFLVNGERSECETWEELAEELGYEGEEVDDEDGEEGAGRSIVKAKYKAKYKPNKGTNGDDFALKFKGYLTVKTEEGPRIDKGKLQAFAEANDVWNPAYKGMLRHRSGPGLVRMNVSNRLRAKVRRAAKEKVKFEIVWP